LIINFVYLDY